MSKARNAFLGVLVSVALAFGMAGFAGVGQADAKTTSPSSIDFKLGPEMREYAKTHTLADYLMDTQVFGKLRSTSKYADSRWPTYNRELLSIPESDRWYNAYGKVGTYGTVAGPVKSVYWAKNSRGMPTFINIGAGYPSSERVQIVIWAEQRPYCEDMLRAISRGGAWVSFTGPISLYNGVPQINLSDGYVEWTWWV